jgi:hypothetical protein
MYRLSIISLFLFALVQVIAAAETVITVTNQNLAFVRESRTIALKEGVNRYTIDDLPAALDPATCLFSSREAGFQVLEKVFRYDLADLSGLLHRALQTNITAISDQFSIRGRLLAYNNQSVFVETSDGLLQAIPRSDQLRIVFDDPGMNYAASPKLQLQAEARKTGAGQIDIAYLTRGMDWEAVYNALYDEGSAALTLSAEVAVSNRSGKSYRQARLRLLAGDLNEAPSYQAPRMQKMMEDVAFAGAAPGEAGTVAEFKIFDMARRSDLVDQEVCYIRFMEPVRFGILRQYSFNHTVDPEGVTVELTARNDKSSGPGVPLPAGTVRIYSTGDQTEYIGADRLPNTAEGEKISLTIGKAFDIRAERRILEQKRISAKSEQMTVQVEIRNHREEAVEISVTEPVPYYRSFEIIKSSHPVTEKEARQINFKVPVAAKDTAILTYTVLFTW